MFWLLIVFIFTDDPVQTGGDLADRQVLPPKIEMTGAACKADALKVLGVEVPTGTSIGVKCDGPFLDPTKKYNRS